MKEYGIIRVMKLDNIVVHYDNHKKIDPDALQLPTERLTNIQDMFSNRDLPINRKFGNVLAMQGLTFASIKSELAKVFHIDDVVKILNEQIDKIIRMRPGKNADSAEEVTGSFTCGQGTPPFKMHLWKSDGENQVLHVTMKKPDGSDHLSFSAKIDQKNMRLKSARLDSLNWSKIMDGLKKQILLGPSSSLFPRVGKSVTTGMKKAKEAIALSAGSSKNQIGTAWEILTDRQERITNISLAS